MGVFSELDLENQQAELEGHDSKTAEMQTLQAKLIQQHEQKKAAAASEAPSKEPAAKILQQRKQKSAVGTRKQKLNGKRNGSGSRRKNVPQKRQRLPKLSR